jgi:Protein of unknown function (DUF3822)
MTKDITTKTYQKLVLEIGKLHISFVVINTLESKVVHLKKQNIAKNEILDEAIWRVLNENNLWKDNYDQVLVLHYTNMCTFVPSVLFDPNFIGSYLQYNNKVFETDYFAYDYIDNYDLNNVFIPFTHINNLLLDHFDTFDYKNSNSVLVKKILDISKNNENKQVFVYINHNDMQIVVCKNQALLLFNSFEFTNKEDFIYYLMFTLEQQQLNPETVFVTILGEINQSDELFAIAYQYIRNISILDLPDAITTENIVEQDKLSHFILLHA